MSNWIEWKWSPEKTYPETLETEVVVKYRDGLEGGANPVSHWYSDTTAMSSWFNTHATDDPHGDDIVAYKLAK